MQNYSTAGNHDLTNLWDQLTEEYLGRGPNPRAREVLGNATASMHLTAHLICGYIGNPTAILRPTMTLPQLADRLHRETEPVMRCFDSEALIETFGASPEIAADSRWLLALWSLVLEMATTASNGTSIEVNIGACGGGFEIEVGHDDRRPGSLSLRQPEFTNTLTGRWLQAICPEWSFVIPACPLGGFAIQMNIPAGIRRQAA